MRLLFVALTLSSLFFGRPQPQQTQEKRENRWVVRPGSELIIQGRSNVNQFTCALGHYPGGDTLSLRLNKIGSHYEFFRSQLAMPVDQIDCNHRMITRDFYKMLDAENYPYINITFKSINFREKHVPQAGDYFGSIEIQIRDRRRIYPIELSFQSLEGDQIKMHGEKMISFTDFGLEPPSKVLGIIRVKEDLKVNFSLILDPLS